MKASDETAPVGTAPTALYAFSGDPITYGHINVVERVAKTFPRVVVGIGRNPTKKYLFDLDERFRLATAALAHLSNVSVKSFHGMVVDFAAEEGATIIVKGVRNSADFDYEQVHHLVGVSQRAGIDTHLLFADPRLAHVSSSAVKAIQIEHGFIHDYVPLVVKAALEEKLSGQLIVGVTGVEAAGKSTLCEELIAAGSARGLAVHNVDLDKLGHSILKGAETALNRRARAELVDRFGAEVGTEDGVDRFALARQVFAEPAATAVLNDAIALPMAVALRKALYGVRGLILLNGALLAEGGMLSLCNNRVILVDPGSIEVQAKRLSARGHDPGAAEKRIAAQWTSTEKHEAVTAAIARDRFGCVWRLESSRTRSNADVAQLLTSIYQEAGTGSDTTGQGAANVG